MPKNLNSDITKLITKYLSIREHSKLELQNKLTQKGHDSNDISDCIDEFSSKDIQSDTRFTEEFIRSKLKKKARKPSVTEMQEYCCICLGEFNNDSNDGNKIAEL